MFPRKSNAATTAGRLAEAGRAATEATATAATEPAKAEQLAAAAGDKANNRARQRQQSLQIAPETQLEASTDEPSYSKRSYWLTEEQQKEGRRQ